MSTHPAAQMPEHEQALLALLDVPPGTVGLFLGKDDDVVGAWHLAQRTSEESWAFTTLVEQSQSAISETESNPLVWLYGEDASPWEGNEVPIHEITRQGLVDVSRVPGSGERRSGAQIAEVLRGAAPGRFFAIGERGNQLPQLITPGSSGCWTSSGCGPDLVFDEPHPHTGKELEEVIDEVGYDTPCLDEPGPEAFAQVRSVRVVGTLPERQVR